MSKVKPPAAAMIALFNKPGGVTLMPATPFGRAIEPVPGSAPDGTDAVVNEALVPPLWKPMAAPLWLITVVLVPFHDAGKDALKIGVF